MDISTKKTSKSGLYRLTAVLAALLLVMLPGMGNLATAARADASSDTSLATFTVDGTAVTDGSTVDVAFGTTSVTVVATPTDSGASAQVTGDTNLEIGTNLLNVLVTAADTTSTQNYSVSIVVPEFNNDTSLKTFTVDGNAVVDGQTINIAKGRTSVPVAVETNDQYATATVAGNTGLHAGSNTVTVTVEADDGTIKTYTVTVIVAAPSSDKTLSSVQINGSNFAGYNSGTYQAPFGTTSVTVAATATSAEALVSVSGTSGLHVGNNTVTIDVVAEDGTSSDYSFVVNVASPDANTNLSTFKVNGVTRTSGGTINLPYGTTAVTVEAATESATSTFAVTGASGLTSGTSTLVVTVTAESGAETDYTITLVVAAASTNKIISEITVNGETVTGNAITLPIGTTSAGVVVTLDSSFASYTISGNDTVAAGTNTRTITVTAQDGSTEQTVLTITVLAVDEDNSLAGITVNGVAVANGGTVNKPFGTSSVTVVATATSAKATVVVSGDTNLISGSNTVNIAVTSEAGVTAMYSFTVVVAQSSNTDVSSIVVDGTNVTSSKTFTAALGATSVTVAVVTADANATYEINGNTGLTGGTNNVTITVTAADGTTTFDHVVVVTVPVPSADTSLASLTVGGVTVSAGDTIQKPNGTSSVAVIATPTSNKASAVVSGNTDLHTGANTVSIAVTAENGDVATYTLTINVAQSSNTSVTSISVDGTNVTTTKTFTTGFGANSVTVGVVTADPAATYEISGASSLNAGANTVTVTVTAADTTTTEDFVLTVTVPVASADNTLSNITVDSVTVAAGGTVNKAFGTGSVTVIATPTDANADAVVSGDTDLHSGTNTVTIAVTAQNGDVATYTITVQVAASSDTTLASILANGSPVTVNGSIEVSGGTTSVLVVASANDPDATTSVTGAGSLTSGSNVITVTVTAADGSTANYTFTVVVQSLSANADLASFTINGINVLGQATLEVDNTVTDALVIAQPDSANATYTVTTATTLAVGANTITVRVTAENGTTADYSVVVTRAAPLSSNTNITSISIGGTAVAVGGTYQAANGTTEVTVDVVTEDQAATFAVVGNTNLAVGNNTVTIVVTAANGDSESFSFTVSVAKSNNTNLTDILVNGTSVGVVDPQITLPSLTTEVLIVAVVADAEASYQVTGPQTLAYGANTFTVTVTAADGSTTADYSVIVTRTPLSANTDLGSLSVNGVTVSPDSTFEVDPGVTSVIVTATAADPDATVTVSGATGLVAGNNPVTVTITAADGTTTADYTFTVFVKSLSNDTTLETITVDGTEVAVGDDKTLDGTKNFVTVIATPNDANASVAITGTTGLQFGRNEVTITVTAEDGTVGVYSIFVIYPNLQNVAVTSFTVNGEEVVDGQTVELDPYTTEVEIFVELEDAAASFEISGGTELQPGENTLTLTITAADGETTAEINVILSVALGNNVDLSSFQVNGADVQDGDVVDLDPYTTEVEVTVEAVDPDATVDVAGESGLVAGENDLTITVTAPDGTVAVYTVALLVAPGNNVELSSFQVNGNDVSAGDVVDIEPYSTSVEVTVETVDLEASFEISGDTDLVPGENTLTVTVTAANGTDIAEYVVTLNVLLGNDVTVTEITVNGNVFADGDSLEVENGTTEVEVLATTTDPLATYAVTGATSLITGENAVVVTVTAQDGTTTAEYTITVVVRASSDATLSSLTIDGNDVVDGETVDLEYGTTEVQVAATATDPDASVEIEGGTDLAPGENLVVVTVTAADGETVVEYTVTLMVALNSDTSLATFQVNGVDVQDGDVVNLDPYTTEAEITAETTDADATVEIEGGTDLVSGENQVTITVTAANKYDSYVYTLTLLVAAGNDVTLATWTVNGDEAADGETLVLAPKTTALEVVVETTDADATFVVSAPASLEVGENLLTVTVTAADQTTIATYTVTLVLRGSDVTLSEFTVNGSPVEDGDYAELPIGTTSAEVVVVTTDEMATYEIEGGTDLVPGENTLTVTVTAADEETQGTYTVTLFVLLNNDTSLSTFTLNGDAVEDGSDIELPPYTDAVDVVATPTDENAQVDIAGAEGLAAGANELVVTVTAADGETVQVYVVSIFVLISTETGLSELQVNGENAIDGDVIFSNDLELTEVDIAVTAIDENAGVVIEGGADLVAGDNLITITVTAPSGDVRVYTVTFRLGGLPGNAKLKTLSVGGTSISLTATDPSITLPAGSKSVAVIASTEDEAATVAITGNKNLVAGANTVTVRVTATDGTTVRDYVVTVNVPALSSNSNISSLKVNNVTVASGDTVTLPAGSRYAEVIAVAEDSSASVTYTGNKDLVAGSNTVTIKVTAADGTFTNYTVVLEVPTLSVDATLKSFTIEGFNVLGKNKLTVASGTRKLRVSAQANFGGASVSISGRDIVPGSNNVVVTVTAADGSTATYTVIVKVKA